MNWIALPHADATQTGYDDAVVLRGVRKRYGRQIAVDALDLNIPRGMTFGLLGPNGAGKSSTIKMLVGLTAPDAGDIELLGCPAGRRGVELKRRIGYVPELHRIYRWMRVDELLRFTAAFYPRWDHDLSTSLLQMFDLPPRRKVKQLSKGMTSKLGLLLALAPQPELLILDEPTSGLDPLIRDEFLEGVLAAHGDDNRTMLFSSHHVDDVQRVADEIGIMDRGQMILREPLVTLHERVKLIRAVLADGHLPDWRPPQTLHEQLDRREWTLTVYPYEPETIERVRSANAIEQIDVFDLGLEELFKHIIRGRRQPRYQEVPDARGLIA